MDVLSFDENVMKGLLKKAEERVGFTDPNPVVAAAVYHGETCISEGVHQYSGSDHAEVIALHKAGKKSKGATLYITLEPCTHEGKTPACVDAIIQAGIAKVVYAMSDPNPAVQARSSDSLLHAAGIDVVKGVLALEAKRLNAPFSKWVTQKRPYLSLKVAMSVDGKISEKKGVSTVISSQDSLAFVHQMRSQVNAILVGIQTVLIDDPLLTIRHPSLTFDAQPAVFILDSQLQTPIHSRVLNLEKRESRCLYFL